MLVMCRKTQGAAQMVRSWSEMRGGKRATTCGTNGEVRQRAIHRTQICSSERTTSGKIQPKVAIVTKFVQKNLVKSTILHVVLQICALVTPQKIHVKMLLDISK